LEALDRYLELRGVKRPRDLPRLVKHPTISANKQK
jgi:hypothetical protein